MKEYIFSIVVPIYNVEKYLEETIESVINQTIGFIENIQLILVNDGSKDHSEEICLKYKEKYPENILYIKQENEGVSSARNKGIEYIKGKYVNFLDGDDKWSLDALEKMYNFLESNYESIDFVVARKQLFEAKDGFHILDYKFEKTKVIDIFEDYNFVQMDVTSVLLKTEIVKKYKFNENLKYAEDAEFINRILLKKRKYGVIREAIHLYRKRLDNTSALQISSKPKSWFINTIEEFHKKIIDTSIELYGKKIPYIQFMIMYDLQWRLKKTNYNALNENEKQKYIDDITFLLKEIEDYIIIEQKNLSSKFKLYALSLKYERDITEDLKLKDGVFYFNKLEVYKIKNKIKIEDLEIKKDILKIKGKNVIAIPIKYYEIYFMTNLDKKTKMVFNEDKGNETITFKEEELKSYTFNIELYLKDLKTIDFIFLYKGSIEQNLAIGIEKNIKLNSLNKFKIRNFKYNIFYKKKRILIKKNSIKYIIKSLLKRICNKKSHK